MIVFLMIFLSGCGAKTEFVRVPVPPAMTVDCPEAPLQGDTWADLAKAYSEAKHSIEACTIRMRAIKQLGKDRL